jgi:hypothetical protein
MKGVMKMQSKITALNGQVQAPTNSGLFIT